MSDKLAAIKRGVEGLKARLIVSAKEPRDNPILADLEWMVGEVERLREELDTLKAEQKNEAKP